MSTYVYSNGLITISTGTPATVGISDGVDNLDINSDGSLSVQGNVAHGAADAKNPIKVGGVYKSAPSAVDDNDVADLLMDDKGRVEVAKLSENMAVADNGADAGNPVKVGGKYNSTLPTLDDGDRGSIQLDVGGRVIVSERRIEEANVADNSADAGNPIKVGAKAKDPTSLDAYTADDRANLHTDLSGRLITVEETLRKQDIANGSADAGNPIKVGGVYRATPTVLDDGDRGDILLDVGGRQIVKSQLQDNAGTAITLGQKTMASSLPVTLASDQSALNVKSSLNVVDLPDSSILNINSTNIPASGTLGATARLEVVASLASNVKKIKIVDDVGEYIGLYTGAANSETLVAVLPLGGGEVEIEIASGSRVSLGHLKNSVINTATFWTCNFLG